MKKIMYACQYKWELHIGVYYKTVYMCQAYRSNQLVNLIKGIEWKIYICICQYK